MNIHKLREFRHLVCYVMVAAVFVNHFIVKIHDKLILYYYINNIKCEVILNYITTIFH